MKKLFMIAALALAGAGQASSPVVSGAMVFTGAN